MASDRFKQLKEMDEDSKAELDREESGNEKSTTSSTGSKGSSSTTGSTSTTSTSDSNESAGSSDGNVKDRNPRMAMFPPEEHKNGFDEALRKVKAICSLADEPEPKKLSEFSGAVLKHGYNDLEGICRELNLKDAYGEYGEVVEG